MNLRRAVQQFIRAEYAFRHGPHCYTAQTQQWYCDALDQLREAATGHTTLPKAAKALGVPIHKPKPLASTPKPKKRKPRQRLRLRATLFD